MEPRILGLHHVTAIAGSAKRNFDFYTKVLGLRLVKKTVNFDDPGTYHFYFGDASGSPGSILTFFPWEGIGPGTQGNGQATEVAYTVPQNSLEFWKARLGASNVHIQNAGTRFGDKFISFVDPDGLPLTFVEDNGNDKRAGWPTVVSEDVAAKGFHSVTLSLAKKDPTAKVLALFGYKLAAQEGNRYRYITDAINTASVIDIIEQDGPRGVNASGTIHHIAFRVKDDQSHAYWRKKIVEAGYQITQRIDRNYFFSLYFREPGGVLFEIATDNPGFGVDEAESALGTSLKLPPQYEAHREKIEKALPAL